VRNHGALPSHLPRYEVVIDTDHTACPCCGGAMHCNGELRSEQLDRAPVGWYHRRRFWATTARSRPPARRATSATSRHCPPNCSAFQEATYEPLDLFWRHRS
jgi:transposase